MRRGALWNPETKASEEETEGHQWKCGEEKKTTAKVVDGEESWKSEDEVYDTKPHRGTKSAKFVEAGIEEDLGRVVCDNIYSAKLLLFLAWSFISIEVESGYLLHKHKDLRCHHRTAVARHAIELSDLIYAFDHVLFLNFKESVHVEHISSCLNFVVSQAAHAVIGFLVTTLAHIPTRGLGAEEDKTADDHGGKHGRT
jgi:hypothetical protein